MEYLFIYCLQLFDCLQIWSFRLISIGIVGISIYLLAVFATGYEILDKERTPENFVDFLNKMKKLLIVVLILGSLMSLLPSKNTLLLMGGVYLGKKAVNTVITDEKVKKVNQIIELELDKRIGELKKYANNDNSTDKQEI